MQSPHANVIFSHISCTNATTANSKCWKPSNFICTLQIPHKCVKEWFDENSHAKTTVQWNAEPLNAPINNFGRYFNVKMNSWDIEGLIVNLTKNTYGPCAFFLIRQMYEEKRIRWDSWHV